MMFKTCAETGFPNKEIQDTPSCPIVDHLFCSFPPLLSQFSVPLLTRRAPPLRATLTATPVLTLTLPFPTRILFIPCFQIPATISTVLLLFQLSYVYF